MAMYLGSAGVGQTTLVDNDKFEPEQVIMVEVSGAVNSFGWRAYASADGAIAYFVDSARNKLMRVECDSGTGLPVGEPKLFVDYSGPGGIDGSDLITSIASAVAEPPANSQISCTHRSCARRTPAKSTPRSKR